MLRRFQNKCPTIAPDVFLADGAVLIGDARLADGASVWFNAVLRADSESITIGRSTNVQDNAVLHVDPGLPCVVGDHVTIGHGAIVHACVVEDNVLIGMHATVLSGAVVGRDSIVGANALVTENARIPPGSLVLGVPGRVIRALTKEEIAGIRRSAEGYVRRAQQYRDGAGDRNAVDE